MALQGVVWSAGVGVFSVGRCQARRLAQESDEAAAERQEKGSLSVGLLYVVGWAVFFGFACVVPSVQAQARVG